MFFFWLNTYKWCTLPRNSRNLLLIKLFACHGEKLFVVLVFFVSKSISIICSNTPVPRNQDASWGIPWSVDELWQNCIMHDMNSNNCYCPTYFKTTYGKYRKTSSSNFYTRLQCFHLLLENSIVFSMNVVELPTLSSLTINDHLKYFWTFSPWL